VGFLLLIGLTQVLHGAIYRNAEAIANPASVYVHALG
jgi:hypothetical protein